MPLNEAPPLEWPAPKRGPGRPPGSKNKPHEDVPAPAVTKTVTVQQPAPVVEVDAEAEYRRGLAEGYQRGLPDGAKFIIAVNHYVISNDPVALNRVATYIEIMERGHQPPEMIACPHSTGLQAWRGVYAGLRSLLGREPTASADSILRQKQSANRPASKTTDWQ